MITGAARGQIQGATASQSIAAGEIVVCSLEPWDDVWRRNQFFVDALLRRSDARRVLFVEPPSDVLFDLANRRRPTRPGLRALRGDGRLQALRPLKPLPRRLGPLSDQALRRSVCGACRRLGFRAPILWLNDVTYAPLIREAGWTTVYDITDDWLLAPFPPREIARLRALDALAVAEAHEVVVCSPALARSRGSARVVTLVPNGVDADHYRRSRPRPVDLPPHPTAVYVGTLHESRLDVDLLTRLAHETPTLSVVLVGPDALGRASRSRLTDHPNVVILGPKPYADVPAYLQHADVLIVPHRLTPFTDSLDPIKAYECLVVRTPTVATPVAGFRDLAEHVHLAEGGDFVARVQAALAAGPQVNRADRMTVDWDERAAEFERILERAVGQREREGR